MEKLLKKFYEQRRFVSIYSNDANRNGFHFGQIMGVGEGYTAIFRVTPNGGYDGILVIETNTIFRMETDCRYTQKMLQLMPPEGLAGWEPVLQETNLMRSFLAAAKKDGKLVSIALRGNEDGDIVGFVDEMDETIICVRQIDDYGIQDGWSYARLEDISSIACDAKEEQRVTALLGEQY